jgi:hypothetical protein
MVSMLLRLQSSVRTPRSHCVCSSISEQMRRSMVRQVEACIELRIILNMYYTRKCDLSAVTHKLNVSRHTMIRIFSLVLVCGTRDQNLSAPFQLRQVSEAHNASAVDLSAPFQVICGHYPDRFIPVYFKSLVPTVGQITVPSGRMVRP